MVLTPLTSKAYAFFILLSTDFRCSCIVNELTGLRPSTTFVMHTVNEIVHRSTDQIMGIGERVGVRKREGIQHWWG